MSSTTQDLPGQAADGAAGALPQVAGKPSGGGGGGGVELTERERSLERKLRLSRIFSFMFMFGLLGSIAMALLMPRLVVFWEGGINNVCEPFATQVIRKLHVFELWGLIAGLVAGLVLGILRNRRTPRKAAA